MEITQTRERKRRGIGSILNGFDGQTSQEKKEKYLNSALTKTDETKNLKLFEIINQLIERGASFDVAADDFEVCGAELLTETEMQFIEANRQPILCTLQQSLLVKHLFSVSADKFDEFAFDIEERSAIVEQCERDAERVYFAAVADVSKRWFAALLLPE